nr:recombinase family protein [Arthrobacter sp. NIO-1057]
MALIGLIRVASDVHDIKRQRDALDFICARVFDKATSRRLLIKNRPELLATLDHLGPNDALVVMKVNHLAQPMIDGLDVLNQLFEQAVAVKVHEGTATSTHIERSSILDAGREIAELRRSMLSWRIKTGLKLAKRRGSVVERPRVIDHEKRAMILPRREKAAHKFALDTLFGNGSSRGCLVSVKSR